MNTVFHIFDVVNRCHFRLLKNVDERGFRSQYFSARNKNIMATCDASILACYIRNFLLQKWQDTTTDALLKAKCLLDLKPGKLNNITFLFFCLFVLFARSEELFKPTKGIDWIQYSHRKKHEFQFKQASKSVVNIPELWLTNSNFA